MLIYLLDHRLVSGSKISKRLLFNAANLESVLEAAARVDSKDVRIDYFRAVVYILRRIELNTAEKFLRFYTANVPERSDYPSHEAAMEWLRRIGQK